MPPIDHILETCLYTRDIAAMERFYVDVVGLRKVSDFRPQAIALRAGAQSVLLIFNPDEVARRVGPVPKHGAEGASHLAFQIGIEDYGAWRTHLEQCAVAIESEVEWGEGAKSIYVRDPAGHSVEFMAGDFWPA